MKFVVTHRLKSNPFLVIMIKCICLFILLFIISNIFNEFQKWGFSNTQIVTSILGNSDLYISKMEFSTLIESLHINLFIYPLLILTLGTVYSQSPSSNKIKIRVMNFLTLFCLLDILSPIMIYLNFPFFAWIKIVGFWGIELLTLFLIFQIWQVSNDQ